jgi:phenylacetate-coenzyme A ligase PaaK-like adenylate-forming protein
MDDEINELARELARLRRRAWMQVLFAWLNPKQCVEIMRRRRLPLVAPHDLDRTSHMLRHAIDHVPFYRSRVAAKNLDLSDPVVALQAFPLVTRMDLQRHFADMIARDTGGNMAATPLSVFRTSGSTGVPCSHIRETERATTYDGLLWRRMLTSIQAPLRGEVVDLGIRMSLDDPYLEPTILPPYSYMWWNVPSLTTPEAMVEAAAMALVAEPIVILGMPSRLVVFEEICRSVGRQLSPRIVLTSFEQLTLSTREHLRAAFRCPVRSFYGTAEMGLLGFECEAGRYHFDEDVSHVEVLDEQGRTTPPGEVGLLVVTSLQCQVMPLIRYASGDLARRPEVEDCPCGRRSPSIASLEGRQSVQLRSVNGDRLSPYWIMNRIDGLGLADYQLVQRRAGDLEVIVRPGSTVDPAALTAIENWLREVRRTPMTVRLVPTGEFIMARNGKRNPVVTFDAQDGAATATAEARPAAES